MHACIEMHREGVKELCHRFGVTRLEAFGSVLGAGFTEESDIDLLVEFGAPCPFSAFEQYFGLKEGLEQLLGRPVDLGVALTRFVRPRAPRARVVEDLQIAECLPFFRKRRRARCRSRRS